MTFSNKSENMIDEVIDEALEKELDISIKEADNGDELSFEEVSTELRKKYDV